jgi:L-gulonate 5-dehydrogenase
MGKGVLINGPKELHVSEIGEPVPPPGEVRVRVHSAGICGSDVHIYHGTHPFVEYPRIIGHEFSGVIDAVGEGVSPARIGTRVSVNPAISCGHCHQCRIGRPNVCENLQVIGVHREGGFADHCCAPAENAHPVPDGISDAAAALVEPFSIAANVLKRTGAFDYDIALVYGAGPIGLTLIQTLKWVYKVKCLIVADKLDSRLALAMECGADIVLDTAECGLKDYLAAEDIQPTLIIDAACHPSILAQATEIAAPAARIGLMGFSSEPSGVSQRLLNAKELSIHASRLNNKLFGDVILWMDEGLLKPEKLISHRFPMTDVQQAFNFIETTPAACYKIILDME